MRSLRTKLTVAFLIIALSGVALVAIFTGNLTRRQFDEFVVNRYQADLATELAEYYARNNNWQGIGDILPHRRGPGNQGMSASNAQPLALADENSRIIYSTVGRYRVGERVAEIGPNGISVIPIEVDGKAVGFLWFGERRGVVGGRGSPEALFLAGVDRVILWSAGGAALLALLLASILAGTISRPISELMKATHVLASGELGHQVPVRTNDEIGQLTSSFNHMSADLAHANELRRQMTADIAHDLRTPLSIILGYSEALAEGKLVGSPEIFGAVHLQARHLNRLIDDLRTLSLADAGQITLARRPIDPRTLLEHISLAYMPSAEAKGITITVTESNVPPIIVDPDRISQVLGNIVGNAIRHTPVGGHIELSSYQADGSVMLQIKDSGPGILPDDLPHIFDRFYRGDTARHPGNGASGLGLAIARSLVEAHGGRIRAANSAEGALFIIELPQTDASGSEKFPARVNS